LALLSKEVNGFAVENEYLVIELEICTFSEEISGLLSGKLRNLLVLVLNSLHVLLLVELVLLLGTLLEIILNLRVHADSTRVVCEDSKLEVVIGALLGWLLRVATGKEAFLGHDLGGGVG